MRDASSDRTASAPLSRGFIPEIDGLRGIAILSVMLHRFWPADGPLARFGSLAQLGWVGVDLFFVISGFLITGILLDTRDDPDYFRNFYARRVLRIFPLYYVYVAAVFLIVPLHEPGSYLQTAFVRSSGSPLWYLLYLGNVPEAMTGHDTPFLVGVLWSLAIEEQFYLLFPLLVALLDRRRLVRLLVAVLAIAPIVRLITMLAFPHNERMQYLATPARVDVIAVGCLVAVLTREPARWVSVRRVGVANALAIVAFVAAFVAGGLDRTSAFGRVLGYSIVAGAFGLLVLWTVLHRGGAPVAALRARPLMHLGKLCYGLYLLHRPAQVVVDAGMEKLPPAMRPAASLVVLTKIGVAVALASLSWRFFEQPILRFKTRFASRSHPSSATAPMSEVTTAPVPTSARSSPSVLLGR